MLLLLSPSKKLDETSGLPAMSFTQPVFMDDATVLASTLKDFSANDLSKLMKISDKLGNLNRQRYQQFSPPFTSENARPALFMFKGDVYDNMDVASYKEKDLAFAQDHVRILSGLYGVLRPLDLMQPYRLEMGTKLENKKGKNLYEFWKGKITEELDHDARGEAVINLASNEYFGAVNPEQLGSPLINIVFRQNKAGKLKTIGLMAKRARGMMADYVIKNKIEKPAVLKEFHENGYAFAPELSTSKDWVFVLDMDG